MDYQRIYDELIADRLRRHPSKGREQGFDLHHIQPRCLGGSNNQYNLISLSYSDHLFAHLLLAKIHGGILSFAFVSMANRQKYKGRASRLVYSKERFGNWDAASAVLAKAIKPFQSSGRGQDHMRNMVNARWDQPGSREYQREKLRLQGPPMLGRKHSPETIAKMKAAWERRKMG